MKILKVISLTLALSLSNLVYVNANELPISVLELRVPAGSSTYNANVAAKAISGYVLVPDQVFSFNRVVGERTSSKGYIVSEMPIRVNGQKKLIKVIGSGICRMSTAMYQLARDVGFTIIERHSHEFETVYARKGDDATISWGSLDNRFKNNTDSTYRIEAFVKDINSNPVITVELYEINNEGAEE